MFGIFKKKEVPNFNDKNVVSPVSGEMILPEKISDTVFNQELMGQTMGFIPDDGEVVCPVNGVVSVVFPTGHAFGIQTKDGTSYLVHIGIDTVSMNGKGFKTFIQQGDTVVAGQKAVEVDLNAIKEAGYETTTMLIVSEKADDFTVHYINCGLVKKGQVINQ